MLIDYRRKEGSNHTEFKSGWEGALVLLVLFAAVCWLTGHSDLGNAILRMIQGLRLR
jgi:hypothetical protein